KYTNNRKRVAVLQAELQDKQGRWEENYEEIKRITSNLNEAWAREETYWHQRSRVKWLNEGDRNTTYFHHSTIARRRQNRILRIQGNNGQWYSGQNATRRVIEEHFKDLFASECVEDDLDILSCVDPVVTEDINTALLQEISSHEIKDAAMQMGSLKAPGPDGYHGIFYQQYWDIIHREVQGIVKDFFAESCNPTTLNSTNIVLIPKVPNPESVTQYRPISLCNYSYKIISKVMANRLKQFIPEIISPAQNAFVPNRQIQDNILLAHEAFHLLKLRKSTKLYELGMKLDMNKAYDRVEWNFLEAMMRKLGFADKWVRLIMSLVKSVELALVINGKPGSYFKPTRGIRQGDPLSPYLFLFANAQNCRNTMNLLNGYCRASGQQINLGKSSVFFSPNTPEELKRELGTTLGMSIVTDPGKYLGLPTLWGRSKSEALNFVKERLLRKIGGWKQGLLSQAGRDILIKSVAQAVPTYPMGIFKFPKSFCQKLEQEIARFWWGQKQDETKVHWISWATLGLPKNQGGMGFRDFNDFNLALLAKQCWRLIMESNSQWAQLLKARYFPECSFLEAKKGGRASWAWASLLEGRKIILQGARWQILNGRQAKIWTDRWIPSLHDGKLHPHLQASVDLNSREDRLVWPREKNGRFSVRSGYHCIHALQVETTARKASTSSRIDPLVWKNIWKAEVPPKIKNFLWRATHDRLPTAMALHKRKIARTPLSPDAHVIKVNFDAAWVASSGKAGAGLIARNANGEFVGAKCLSFQAESSIMAEAIAGLEGCKWASELGLSEVCFEYDSKELVESVKGNIKRGRWNLYPLLSRIRECNSIFSNCNWAWTGRKNNEAADHLASLALSRSSPEVWVSRPPTSLVHILNRDGLPCPPRAST
ncbi:unnamed protein product, partial [Prunus brigantina]